MAWELDAGRPIYAQLVERIQREIVSGQYRPGEKLPSVRDLAAVAAGIPENSWRSDMSGILSTTCRNWDIRVKRFGISSTRSSSKMRC